MLQAHCDKPNAWNLSILFIFLSSCEDSSSHKMMDNNLDREQSRWSKIPFVPG